MKCEDDKIKSGGIGVGKAAPEPFLRSVARELLAAGGGDVSRVCVVTPSKRAATFLRKYLTEETTRPEWHGRLIVLPQMLTISDFVGELSGLVTDSRLDLLFTLFDEYRRLSGDAEADFDKFRVWGETVVADFNDVDMYEVDAAKMYANLADLRDIKSNYLTAEQREVIREYFGEEYPEQHLERFWKHLSGSRRASRPFTSLWEMLHPLYEAFNANLRGRGLCYSAGAYREACRRLEEERDAALPWDKVVMVGFNALSTVERHLFGLLQKMRRADFFWDYTGRPLSEGERGNSAVRFLHKNARRFPSSVDMDKYRDSDRFPDSIRVIACPGNSVQAKVTAELLADITRRIGPAEVAAAKVAVVLPDEGLLFPMIYSLPEGVESVNLTMGYPLRLTAAASWVAAIRRMQLRRRSRRGEIRFFKEDVEALLAHQVTALLLGDEQAQTLRHRLAEERMFDVSIADLRDLAKGMPSSTLTDIELIFNTLLQGAEAPDVCRWLHALTRRAVEALQAAETGGSATLNMRLERSNFREYSDAVVRFEEAARGHDVHMGWRTALSLIDRLLSAEKVSLQGEPLRGVQIMGMLETRGLDFDYVIIPSMNERIFPRRLKARTFIPNSLRRGYGMATTRFQESIFAYYFYRLISRAKEVCLLYDSRSGGLRSGDPSRYLLQLKHLYPECNLQHEARRFRVSTAVTEDLTVRKTPEVMVELREFLTPGSGRNISASALKNYMTCPLKFYLENVRRIRVEDDAEEFMDAATQGSVFHGVMQRLYESLPRDADGRVRVTAEAISAMLALPREHPQSVRSILEEELIRWYAHSAPKKGFSQGDLLFAEVLEGYVRDTLRYDLEQAPFVYLGGELSRVVSYPLCTGEPPAVNVKFIIDRVDAVTDSEGRETLRLIDYKTGRDELSFNTISGLLKGDNGAAFQLMMYACMYPYATDGPDPDTPMRLGIYKIRTLQEANAPWELMKGDTPLGSHFPYKQEFMQEFDRLLREIFDPEVPFAPCDSKGSAFDKCSWCDMKGLCRR